MKKFNLSSAVIGHVDDTGLFTCLFDGNEVTSLPVTLLVEDTPKYNHPLQSREEYLKNHALIENVSKEIALDRALAPVVTPQGDKQESTATVGSTPRTLSLNGAHLPAHKEILQGISLENLYEKFPHFISQLFSHPAFASRQAIYHNYCSTVQGNTVTGCGTYHSSAAAVVRLPHSAQDTFTTAIGETLTNIGLSVSSGCEERWVELDP